MQTTGTSLQVVLRGAHRGRGGWHVCRRQGQDLPQRATCPFQKLPKHVGSTSVAIKPQWVILPSTIKSYKETHPKKSQFLFP